MLSVCFKPLVQWPEFKSGQGVQPTAKRSPVRSQWESSQQLQKGVQPAVERSPVGQWRYSAFSVAPANKVQYNDVQNVNYRAGHATTLSRLRDHIFRPQYCWLLYITSRCVVATTFRYRGLNIFRIFSCHNSFISLLRCRCRKAK